MLKTKNIIYIIAAFIIISTVIAQPPFDVQQSGTGTLSITYPFNPAFQLNKPFMLHFHVYNSTGTLMTDSEINFCTFHLYNFSNNHIIVQNLTYEGVEFDIAIDTDYINASGVYPYMVYCEGIDQDGFTSGSISITNSGGNYELLEKNLFVLILIPIIFGIVLIFATYGLGDAFAPLKLAAYMLFPITILSSLHFAETYVIEMYPRYYAMQNLIAFTTNWVSWVLYIIIAVIFLWFIKTAFEYIKNKNDEEMRY